MAKNKQSTFAALIADSDPIREQVQIGSHTVTIEELSGKTRFELGTKGDDERWSLMLWICMQGLVDPKPADEAELEKIKAEWVVKIATAIMKLSGIEETPAEIDATENA